MAGAARVETIENDEAINAPVESDYESAFVAYESVNGQRIPR
jgi:hypothetical protein